MQRPWGGWAGLRGEGCPLKTCVGGGLQGQEGPRFTQIYLEWVGPFGGWMWSY